MKKEKKDICSYCEKEMEGGLFFDGPKGKEISSCFNDACEKLAYRDMAKRKKEELFLLEKNNQCRFEEAWRGYCKKPGYPICPLHKIQKCVVCKSQAIKECEDAGSFVCGNPLCKQCSCPRSC